MARLSDALLASLARPAFTEGLFQAGQAIGSAPRRAQRKQEMQQAQAGLFSAMTASQEAALAGDVDELRDINAGLMDMLNTVKDENVRSAIGEGMGQISQLMVAAQPQYITNQARALNGLRTRKEDLESQIADLNSQFESDEGNFEIAEKITAAENQLSALDSQIEKASGNADVLVKANTMKFNSELAAFTNEIELEERANTYYALQLRGLPKDGERYNKVVAAAEKAGANGAVALDNEYRRKQEMERLDLEEKRQLYGKLSDGEIAEANQFGVKTEGQSPAQVRKLVEGLKLNKLERQQEANLTANLSPGAVAGKAYAKLVLNELQKAGETEPGLTLPSFLPDIKIPFFDDLGDKIEDMTAEQRELIFESIPENATYDQIIDKVTSTLRGMFPDQFEDFENIVPEFDRKIGFESLVRQIALDNPDKTPEQHEAAALGLINDMKTAIEE